MPVIKEKDLLDLYAELDGLKVDKEELQKGFINLKINTTKNAQHLKTAKIFLVLIVIVFITSFVFLYNKFTVAKEALKESNESSLVLIDSIQKLKILTPFEKNPVVSYAVQLGVFEILEIDFNDTESSIFKKRSTSKGTAYQIGSFTSYRKATAFKNQIRSIGLKSVFLVAYDKNLKRIDIEEALILSKEEQFIKK
jgi:hypothetical protein